MNTRCVLHRFRFWISHAYGYLSYLLFFMLSVAPIFSLCFYLCFQCKSHSHKRQFRVPSLLGVTAWGAGGCSTWQSSTLVVEGRDWEERHAWSERCLLLLTFPVFCWAVSTCFKDVVLQPNSKWASIFHETLTCLSAIDIVLLWIKYGLTRFVNHYIQFCFVF